MYEKQCPMMSHFLAYWMKEMKNDATRHPHIGMLYAVWAWGHRRAFIFRLIQYFTIYTAAKQHNSQSSIEHRYIATSRITHSSLWYYSESQAAGYWTDEHFFLKIKKINWVSELKKNLSDKE